MTLVYDTFSGQLVETGEPKQTQYSSLAQLRDDYAKRMQAIADNLELPDKAKALKLAQLKTEARDEWAKLKQSLEAKNQAELQAAWKKANPASNVADMSPGQVAARQEALADIAAITESIEGSDPAAKHGAGEAILNLYGQYAAQGYEIGMDAVAQRAGRYLNADQAKELRQMEDYRKPALAEARKNLEDLRTNQAKDGTAQAMMEGTFMQQTALTSSESEALARQPQQPPAAAVEAWQQAQQQD